MLKNNRGSILIGALITASMVAILAGVVATQFQTTNRASMLPRIRSNMMMTEIQLRNLAVNPATYLNCDSGLGVNTCTVNLAIMEKFNQDLRNLKLKIDTPVLDRSVTPNMFRTKIMFDMPVGKNMTAVQPRIIAIPVPLETLQPTTFVCDDPARPFFFGFDTNGSIRCRAASAIVCPVGQYVSSIDRMTLDPVCTPAGQNVTCAANEKLGTFTWNGGALVGSSCVARTDPAINPNPCIDGTCPPVAPTQCPAISKNWVVSGHACVANIAATAAGSSGTATDSAVDPYVGTATFACSLAGTWSITPSSASCAANPCPAEPKFWTAGGYACSANVPATAPLASAVAVDNTPTARGSATYVCQADGTWGGEIGVTCAGDPCPAATMAWAVGALSCSAPTASMPIGSTSLANDSTGTEQGTATFTCQSNSSWALNPGATCIAPAPPVLCYEHEVYCKPPAGSCESTGVFTTPTSQPITTIQFSRCPGPYVLCGMSFYNQPRTNAADCGVVTCPVGSSAGGLGGPTPYAGCSCSMAGNVWNSVAMSCGAGLVYGPLSCTDTGYLPGTECSVATPGCSAGAACTADCTASFNIVGGQCGIFTRQCAPAGTHAAPQVIDAALCGMCPAGSSATGSGGALPAPNASCKCSVAGQTWNGSACAAPAPTTCPTINPQTWFGGGNTCSGVLTGGPVGTERTLNYNRAAPPPRLTGFAQYTCQANGTWSTDFADCSALVPGVCWSGNIACDKLPTFSECQQCQHDGSYGGTCSMVACF